MLCSQLKELILHNFNTLKLSRKAWNTANCPMCVVRGHRADRRGRFGIKFSDTDGSIGMNCFNCGFHAKWVPGSLMSNSFIEFLYSIRVSEDDIRKIKFQAYRERHSTNSGIPSLSLSSLVTGQWKAMDLPPYAFPISFWLENQCVDGDFINVVNYLRSRGIDMFDDLYWTPEKERMIHKRVIIPCVYRGNVVGYSARLASSCADKRIPKYINYVPDSFVFNLDNQSPDRKYCILCEGILDALLVDGISCLGNSINRDQIGIINNLKKDIIVCPDRDSSGKSLIDVAVEQGWMVSIPRWDRGIKDSADAVMAYGRILTVKSIIDAREKNQLKIHISRKFDGYE